MRMLRMNKMSAIIPTLALLGLGVTANAALPGLVPVPVAVKELPTKPFVVGSTLKIGYERSQSFTKESAAFLAEYLKTSGVSCRLKSGRVKGGVSFVKGSGNFGSEGYTLSVNDQEVVVRADSSAGLFYGIQTLRQLLPAEATFGKSPVAKPCFSIPAVEIEDQPAYRWRGYMLDCSRHFFSEEEVKKILDLMASQKMNLFHWHLTDDQGWRIEIKKYPQLTEIGAWRDGIGFGFDPKMTTHYRADGKYGGFYTQDEIKEIVAYAAKRHITIMPEIDMPGHSEAALVVKPQLSCFPEGLKNHNQGLITNVYCAGKEETFQFMEDVYSEVMALFPGKFIHIGGDECRKENWRNCSLCQQRMKENGLKNEEELQSYVIKRMEAFVNSKGHALIGWDEILEGGLAPRAAVMSWRGTSGGIQAAAEGHDVVMAPNSHCYFDHGQGVDGEPVYQGGNLFLKTVYSFDPADGIPADKLGHVLGGQACLWAEFIPNESHAEYMTAPRLSALAEALWSPKANRDWASFQIRLQDEFKRYEAAGLNYRNPRTGDPK